MVRRENSAEAAEGRRAPRPGRLEDSPAAGASPGQNLDSLSKKRPRALSAPGRAGPSERPEKFCRSRKKSLPCGRYACIPLPALNEAPQWQGSSVGQSMRFIPAVSRVQISPLLPESSNPGRPQGVRGFRLSGEPFPLPLQRGVGEKPVRGLPLSPRGGIFAGRRRQGALPRPSGPCGRDVPELVRVRSRLMAGGLRRAFRRLPADPGFAPWRRQAPSTGSASGGGKPRKPCARRKARPRRS